MGYVAAILIGISLGLIGGGGSILTVPVLVYLFGVSPLVATSYSLFVVGITSLAGTASNFRRGLVDVKTALLFGVSSIATVFITRRYIIPAIPESFTVFGWPVSFAMVTMVLFALLMLAASFSMIRGRREAVEGVHRKKSFVSLAFYGIAIGLITGFLGAGGGFLLVPALVLLLHLPMKKAIGTSLLIIALNSLIGFAADRNHSEMNWQLLFIITALAIVGVVVGGLLGKKIPGAKLKKGFGWFVLLMGVYIIVREMFPG